MGRSTKISTNLIDEILLGRGIKRLEDFDKRSDKILFVCVMCENTWHTSLNDLLKRQTDGCPACGAKQHSQNLTLTNDEVDQLLLERPIKRISDYKGANTLTLLRCLVEGCGHEWWAKTGNVINSGKKCPKCMKHLPLTNEIVDERLKERPIQRLDDFITVMTPIRFQCLIGDCRNIWKATPDNIFHGKGCPLCKTERNERRLHKILTTSGVPFEFQFNIQKINKDYPKFVVDFYLPTLNWIIEYNGSQHYEPVRWFGAVSKENAELAFQKQVIRDDTLRSICFRDNIALLVIDGRKFWFQELDKYMELEILPAIQRTKTKGIQHYETATIIGKELAEFFKTLENDKLITRIER